MFFLIRAPIKPESITTDEKAINIFSIAINPKLQGESILDKYNNANS